MCTGAAGGQARSLSRTATAIRDLHPGSFAFVMATGIISTGTFLLGPAWLSRALLAAASAGLVVLSAALLIRLAIFRSDVAADIQAPERVFGFFTIVAGFDVLGVRLAAAGHPLATAILAALAAALWLVLTYGVPSSLLLARSATRSSAASTAHGSSGWSARSPSRSRHRPLFRCGPRKLGYWRRPLSACGASGWCCTCCSSH